MCSLSTESVGVPVRRSEGQLSKPACWFLHGAGETAAGEEEMAAGEAAAGEAATGETAPAAAETLAAGDAAAAEAAAGDAAAAAGEAAAEALRGESAEETGAPVADGSAEGNGMEGAEEPQLSGEAGITADTEPIMGDGAPAAEADRESAEAAGASLDDGTKEAENG